MICWTLAIYAGLGGGADMRCWLEALLLAVALARPALGGAQGLSPLADPTSAVTRALLDLGFDPGRNYRPSIQAAVRRADEIVYLVVLRNPEVLADEVRFRVALR